MVTVIRYLPDPPPKASWCERMCCGAHRASRLAREAAHDSLIERLLETMMANATRVLPHSTIVSIISLGAELGTFLSHAHARPPALARLPALAQHARPSTPAPARPQEACQPTESAAVVIVQA